MEGPSTGHHSKGHPVTNTNSFSFTHEGERTIDLRAKYRRADYIDFALFWEMESESAVLISSEMIGGYACNNYRLFCLGSPQCDQ